MISTIDSIRFLPELVLTVFGIAVMMIDPLLGPKTSRKGLGVLSLLGCVAAIAATICQATHLAQNTAFSNPGWFGMVQVDTFSIFFHFLIPSISAISILASSDFLDQQNTRTPDSSCPILSCPAAHLPISSST